MPSRTIEQSHRRKVSDRTMHCHSKWTIVRLVVSKPWAPSRQPMEPQHRTMDSPLYPRRRSKSFRLGKTTLSVRVARSNSWAECRDQKDRHRAVGEIFFLTFLYIGLFRLRDYSGVEG